MSIEADENCKAFADAQVKVIHDGHAHKLNALRNSCETHKSGLLQQRDK